MNDKISLLIRFHVNEDNLEYAKAFFKKAFKKNQKFKKSRIYAVLCEYEQWVFGEMDYTATLTTLDPYLNKEEG